MKHLLASLIFLFSATSAILVAYDGKGTSTNPYLVPRASSAIDVDGVLDELVWQDALLLELKLETFPGENTPAPVETIAYVTFDQTNLFIGFKCYDPNPSATLAHYTDHDGAWRDDMVSIILDTFNDERRSYIFSANPHGCQYDAIKTAEGEDGSWDAIWDSAGRIYDWGFSVEMAIPFNQLQFQRSDGDGQTWGLIVWRIYPRKFRYFFSHTPVDRNNDCLLCQSMKIKGFEGAKPGRNLEITPTVTAVSTDKRSELPAGGFVNADRKADIGLTARWGLTPNLKLSAAVNPDFSQVEADAMQLDINEPFALEYLEKRPFFTEGVDFFRGRFNAVYTRTMRDPTWGIKLSGKEGGNTLGAYVVQDNLTNLVFPGSQESATTSLAADSTAMVLRYKRDIGWRYTMGALLTDREGNDYYNRTFGFDGDFRFTDNERLRWQVLGSGTRYPAEVAVNFSQPQDSFYDRAVDVLYTHDTRNFSAWLGYQDVGEGFRADVGFMPQVDYRGYYGGTGYTWLPRNGSWWSSFNINGEYSHHVDQDGNLLSENFIISLNYQGALQSGFYPVFSKAREAFNGREFDTFTCSLYGEIKPVGTLTLQSGVIFGDRIDYANTRPGKRLGFTPGFLYNLGRHLRLSFYHSYEKLNIEGSRLYTANISRGSVAYQLNARTRFRALLQYVSYARNTDLYTFDIDPVYKRLFTQFLFSYKMNPQTVLFIGYSDNYLGSLDCSLTQSDRTFFVKLGYAWTL